MKISLNWVRDFTSVKLPIDELVRKIGAQLGEVEEVINLGERYQGVTVVKVVSCEKHPNADKLNVCKIDDGGVHKAVKRDAKGLVQVVCGAPNVRAGITVAWVPPGAIVPSTYDKEQFKLDVRPLRGIDSNGMLASGQELAINDDHSGILILDKPAKPGTPLAEVYDLDDYIIEVENKMFTHRPDCFGMLGVAREIAGISQVNFTSPDWYKQPLDKLTKGSVDLPLKVDSQISKLVPRFMALTMSGISVAKSPITMQSYLTRVGIKPINNVVDITNFVMMLTGQPLHAYDYDKVAFQDKATEAMLVIRKPKKGEQISLLNGKTIEPRADSMMIATKDRLIGMGGIMGGSATEVDETTTNIILECASFDMYAIRKTSMAHGLFTDAVTRFNKGQSPLQNDIVLAYAAGMLQKLASGHIASPVTDTAPDKTTNFWPPFTVGVDFVNDRLGLTLSQAEMAKLLDNVEILAEPAQDKTLGKALRVSAPFWRTDLEIPEDIVEEIGRLYGYDHLPLELPTRSLIPAVQNPLFGLKQRIRTLLASAGANEVLTYSFVHGNLLEKAGQDAKQAFELSNALSPDLQYYRLSLTPSLLEKVHPNIKVGYDSFALFELNKTHNKQDTDDEKLPKEHGSLAFVVAAADKSTQAQKGSAYYQAKHYLVWLLEQFGVSYFVKFVPLHEADLYKNQWAIQMAAIFDPKRSAALIDAEGLVWGIVGEYAATTRKALKLPVYAAGFELDPLLLTRPSHGTYKALSRYPATDQDISLQLDADTPYHKVQQVVDGVLQEASEQHGYHWYVSVQDIYQPTEEKGKEKTKNVTLRIKLWHTDRTLVTKEVNELLDTIAKATHAKLRATRL